MGKSEKANSLKSAVMILGALAAGWLTIEMAFKPYLAKFRAAMDKSDPTYDPDDVVDAAKHEEEEDLKVATLSQQDDDEDDDDAVVVDTVSDELK